MIVSPAMQLFGSTHDVHQLLKKPLIYFRQFVHLIDRIAGTKGFRNNKDTFIRRFPQRFIDVGDDKFLVFYKAVHPLPYHAKPFLDSFFKSTADGHHLTYRLHGRTQLFIDAMKFT